MVNEYQSAGLAFFGYDDLQHRCHTCSWGFEGNGPVSIDSLAVDNPISSLLKAVIMT